MLQGNAKPLEEGLGGGKVNAFMLFNTPHSLGGGAMGMGKQKMIK